jgi:hypothetical protein
MSGMGRREFAALLGGAVGAFPLTAPAQQATMPTLLSVADEVIA